MVYGILLFILGAAAAPNVILSRRPDAKVLLDKFAPYQGYFGALMALWGVWGVVWSIVKIGWLGSIPVYWITFFVGELLNLSLGLLLGIGVLKQWIKQPDAQQRMDDLAQRLAPKQGILGMVAMGWGVWFVIADIIW